MRRNCPAALGFPLVARRARSGCGRRRPSVGYSRRARARALRVDASRKRSGAFAPERVDRTNAPRRGLAAWPGSRFRRLPVEAVEGARSDLVAGWRDWLVRTPLVGAIQRRNRDRAETISAPCQVRSCATLDDSDRPRARANRRGMRLRRSSPHDAGVHELRRRAAERNPADGVARAAGIQFVISAACSLLFKTAPGGHATSANKIVTGAGSYVDTAGTH